MKKIIEIQELTSKETPREIIREDFKMDLPISGGWGYTQDQAVSIDKDDISVNQEEVFDGVEVEYKFVEKRIYEEMIIFRKKGERFSGIYWKIIDQKTIEKDGRMFDKLRFSISALLEDDFDNLKKEMEELMKNPSNKIAIEENLRKKDEKTIILEKDFWFDITSFFGQGLVIVDKETGKKKLLKLEEFKLNLSKINNLKN